MCMHISTCAISCFIFKIQGIFKRQHEQYADDRLTSFAAINMQILKSSGVMQKKKFLKYTHYHISDSEIQAKFHIRSYMQIFIIKRTSVARIANKPCPEEVGEDSIKMH